jgi:hypothetical protein
METFTFDPAELPEVVAKSPSGYFEVPHTPPGEDGAEFGRIWSMSVTDDGDLEQVRRDILCWIAWYRFLQERDRGPA